MRTIGFIHIVTLTMGNLVCALTPVSWLIPNRTILLLDSKTPLPANKSRRRSLQLGSLQIRTLLRVLRLDVYQFPRNIHM